MLYNAVLLSTVQQSESAIRIHISPLLWISSPSRSPPNTEESSPFQTEDSLVVDSILPVESTHVSVSSLQFPSHPPPFLVPTHMFPRPVFLLLLCTEGHLHHFPRFHKYTHISECLFFQVLLLQRIVPTASQD